MSVRRVAMLSVHTSPLDQPGSGDGGGMNVYVASLASALTRAGVECDVLTRAEGVHSPGVVEIEPGVRVVHLAAGGQEAMPKYALPEVLGEFTDAANNYIGGRSFDALHAHYWLSGAVGHQLKHDLGLPLVTTFHTLAATKAAAGIHDDPITRVGTEREIVACADRIIASAPDEAEELLTTYGARTEKVEVIPPGVDHELFSPGDRHRNRQRLGLDVGLPILLFVGRIQPLKGVDRALRALAELPDPRALLVVVGGPSGADGEDEVARLKALAQQLGIVDRVRWVSPQPHGALASWYRAADVCLVPSRTESFGLVALEAAACGLPVVATDVGGLQSLVDDGETGFLVDAHGGEEFAVPIAQLMADPALAAEIGARAAARSGRYAWSMTAARLRRIYADVGAYEPVFCR